MLAHGHSIGGSTVSLTGSIYILTNCSNLFDEIAKMFGSFKNYNEYLGLSM